MSVMIALGLASIMLCFGLIIRSKAHFLNKMLMPTSVIAGLLGFIIMNSGFITSVESGMYADMVNILFTIVFISIGLTSNSKLKSGSSNKDIARGSMGMGFIWMILYALTPAIGAAILFLGIGNIFDIDPIYGLLIPFAFAQGPGQAATFGSIMEQQYGIADAATVGITFAAIGFLVCFLVGIPLAKYGIKKGLTKNMSDLETKKHVERGYYAKNEESKSIGNETMFSGNLDTMTFHFAIIGLCFILALGMTSIISLIPAIGEIMAGMLFVYGMFAAYLVKYVMKKFKIDYLIDNTFQSKFTGWATDYLVVTAFMAITLNVIGKWIIPILIVSLVITVVTLLVCIYFGQRIGGENDFERTLGLFGAATGTVASGIALVRIVDPSLKTSTAAELGLMNIPMKALYATLFTIFGIASGLLSWNIGFLILLAPIPVFLIVLKILKAWGGKSYVLNFKSKKDELTSQKVKMN